MKANYQMSALPRKGVQVTVEGALTRLLFDFSKVEPAEDSETSADDIYDCESVDVTGRSYGAIVAAIVNDRYSPDDVQAVMANYAEAIDENSDIEADKRAEYVAEYATYQQFRHHAKEIAATAVEILSN